MLVSSLLPRERRRNQDTNAKLMSTRACLESTESEIISLDTGLRLDGLPALELWELFLFLEMFLVFQIDR